MKESAWRYKLVQKFKEHNPHGFIWAHDAHFKTGFPDLTTIVQGTTKLIELKDKVQRTPNVLGRNSEIHRGIKAKVKCFYDYFTPTEELEVLLTKDKVDFAHKDWYSV